MILVTGGAGYVGSHAAQALKDAGFEPVIFDNFSSGHRDFVKETPTVNGDICNNSDLESVFERFDIDGVLHFAGRAVVEESKERPYLYYETNVVGGWNLLRVMKAASVGYLIFSSSCAIYGHPQSSSLAEDHPKLPINPYGETKLAFERSLAWSKKEHGLEYLALRYFNASGADPDLRFGEDHNPETHLIPLVLSAAAGRRDDFIINGTDYSTSDGTCVRDYVHVSDLAVAHVKGLQLLMSGKISSQSINLGTGLGSSVREVIATARKITGRQFRVEIGPSRPGDPSSLIANTELAAKLLDWEPQNSELENILKTAWDWTRKRNNI